jgi:hypothetical protein
MFDDKSYLRSKTYFQMQQLCRIFCTITEETIKDIKETQSKVLFVVGVKFCGSEGFEGDFEALSTKWNEHTTDQIA